VSSPIATRAQPAQSVRDGGCDRSSIGDRTPGLRHNADGSVTIELQADPPDGDIGANWLPTPPGDFRPILRIYEPGDSVLDATYQLPDVKRLD
jgi:hypothetical protein